jgi:hypothetical protein
MIFIKICQSPGMNILFPAEMAGKRGESPRKDRGKIPGKNQGKPGYIWKIFSSFIFSVVNLPNNISFQI